MSKKRAMLVVLIVSTMLGVSGRVAAQDGPLDRALAAIGGREALENLTTFVIETSGTRLNSDEGLTPDAPAMTINEFATTVSYDVAGDNLRLDHQNTITAFGLSVPQVYSEIIAGDLGYIAGTDNILGLPARDMLSDRWAVIRKQQRLLNPHLLVLDILADPSIATDGGDEMLDGADHHRIVVAHSVSPITLYVDAATGLITRASTMENHYLHRDVTLEVRYGAWRPAGAGVLFPTEVTSTSRGKVIQQERRSVRVDVPLDDELFAFPEGAAPSFDEALARRGEVSSSFQLDFVALGLPQDGVQTFVQAELLAPGVYHLTGGSHHSMVVEQESGVVVVEAPLYGPRSRAVIEWVEATFPDKPISHVIVSHFHEDHAGGVRTFVARGATVVISDTTADFMAAVFEAPSTILPDALELAPVDATFATVPPDGPLTLDDATRPVTVYHVANSHAADLVMTHLPNEGILFVVDLYNPGLPAVLFPTGPAEVLASIRAHGLDVSTIAGGHAGVSSLADLEAQVGP